MLDLLVSSRLMESGVAFLIVHYINWKREWERVRISSSWSGLHTYDSEVKAEKETQQNEIGCIFLSPIVWGAAPRRNFTTSGWPNLKKLMDKPNIGNFLPCAIVESSFGRLINCKQREALPVSKSYLLNPTSPHCGVVWASAHRQASQLSKPPPCFAPTIPRCPWPWGTVSETHGVD